MALIFRFNTRYKEPDTYDDAKEQSLHQKPYKPVYATEAYEALIEDCVHYIANPTIIPKPKNPDVLHRVTEVYNGLLAAASHPDEDVDFTRGQNNWFVDKVKELMNQMTFYSVSVNSTLCSVTGAGIYQEFTSCTLVASPNAHASFTSNPWTGLPASAVISADFKTVTFDVDQDYNITCSAVEDPKYTLTFNVADSTQGSIDVTAFTSYSGETVTVTATPVRSTIKYHFVNWKQGTTEITTENPHEFTVGTSDETFTCYFEEDSKYTLTFLAINGSVSPESYTGYVDDQVTVTFTPATHHHFGSWSDGNTDNPRTFTIESTASYTANGVEDDKHTITFVATTGGTVSQSSFTGYPGDNTSVYATADLEHDFEKWSDGVTTSTRTATVLDTDYTLTASFTDKQYTLTFEPSVAGAGTCEPSTFTGIKGSTVSVTATAAAGYKLSQWAYPWRIDFMITTTYGRSVYRNAERDTYNGSVLMYNWGGFYFTDATPTLNSHIWTYEDDAWIDKTSTAGYWVTYLKYVSDNPYTYTVGASDFTYQYTFAELPTVTYTFTGTNGTCSPETHTGRQGTTVEVTFTPDEHYHFEKWDDEDTNNPRTFTLGDTAATYTVSGVADTKHSVYLTSSSPLGTVSPAKYIGYPGETFVGTATPVRTSTMKGHFWKWQGDTGVYTDNPHTFTVGQSNVSFTGWFLEDSKYTLTFNGVNGTCSPSSYEGYEDDTVEVTFTPDTHYAFTSWNDGNTENPRTFTVGTSAETYTATAAEEGKYTLTFTTDGNGTVSPTTYTGYAGETVEVTATPSSHYEFSQWNDGDTSNPRTFTVGSASVTYTATFTEETKHTLNFTGTNCTCSPSSYEGYAGDTVTVTVSDFSTHYHWGSWNDGDTSNPRTFTVGSTGKTYIANAEEDPQYTLTFNVAVSGTGSLDHTELTGYTGDSITVTATPTRTTSAKYHFDHWDDGTTDNPKTFTIADASVDYTVYFTEDDKYTLAFTAGTGGSVEPTSFTGYDGDSVEVTATGDTGYKFSKWNDDVTTNPRTFVIESASASYTATFEEQSEYTLTFYAYNGTVSQETFTGVTGDSVSITVTPNNHYHFTKWNDSTASTDNPRTFVIGTESVDYTATCEQDSKYTYTFSAVNGTPSVTSATGYVGDIAIVTITPDTHYHFSAWNDGNTDNPRTFTFEAEAKSFTATCEQDETHTFTFYVQGTGGSVSTNSATAYVGDTIRVSGIPDTGYNFVEWDDGSIYAGKEYTVGTSDESHYCTFEAIPDYVTMIFPGGSGSYTFGRSDIYSYFEESYDTLTWTTITSQTVSVTAEKYYLRGTVGTANLTFVFSAGTFTKIYGNLSALLDYTGTSTFTIGNHLNGMFSKVTSLVDASGLNLYFADGTVETTDYGEMFSGCTNLTAGPQFNAPSDAIFYGADMFAGCTSLITVPDLSSIKNVPSSGYAFLRMFENCTALTYCSTSLNVDTAYMYSYNKMFYGCTSLLTGPDLTMDLAYGNVCEAMFYGCTALTKAPNIVATTLWSAGTAQFNKMFYNCSSMVYPPNMSTTYPHGILFNTTLVASCYSYMFYGCTSLIYAPELPATKINKSACYEYMFNGCSALTYIRTLATTGTASYLSNWVKNVGKGGTFYCPTAGKSFWTSSLRPSGWSVVYE